MVILQGAEINVFRFPLGMLIRMPSTRVCRSWWWRRRRRWQPDQWRLRWWCGEGISESWWWALNEPSNSSSRRLCIGWKEKVVLLVLVSTPYLHKRIFFSPAFVCHFLFGESLVMITNVVSQFHRVLLLLLQWGVTYIRGIQDFTNSSTVCTFGCKSMKHLCKSNKKKVTKEWTE